MVRNKKILTIPDSTENIEALALTDGKFTSITNPNSVTSIGESTFQYCDSLETVYYKGTSLYTDNIAFIGEHNECLTKNVWFYS